MPDVSKLPSIPEDVGTSYNLFISLNLYMYLMFVIGSCSFRVTKLMVVYSFILTYLPLEILQKNALKLVKPFRFTIWPNDPKPLKVPFL